jgi:hypothetical protein
MGTLHFYPNQRRFRLIIVGNSGNMPKTLTDIRSLARSHTESSIRTLAHIAAQSESDAARVMAANSLLDRGWGKPPQAHTGEDGEGDIRITIRHIMEGTAVPTRAVPAIEASDASKIINGRKDL